MMRTGFGGPVCLQEEQFFCMAAGRVGWVTVFINSTLLGPFRVTDLGNIQILKLLAIFLPLDEKANLGSKRRGFFPARQCFQAKQGLAKALAGSSVMNWTPDNLDLDPF